MLGAIYWNPPREAFVIPYFNHPVMWYGVLFVLGFICGYYIVYSIFKRFLIARNHSDTTSEAITLADRLTWFVVGGTVIGARLGHVLFYAPAYYASHPLEILQTWKGGLASHGGTIGILIALFIYGRIVQKKYPELSFVRLIDIVAIPAALAGMFIRLGNFMNQELIGTSTTVPWAVIFGSPADGSFPTPRHPVVLYEALSYLCIFIFLYTLWRRFGFKLRPGIICGLLLSLVFTSRFFLEFWKSEQHGLMSDGVLQTGQYLSLPFIALGIFLYFFGSRLANKQLQEP